MGQRILDKAVFYLKRSNRKRLGPLPRKHRYLLNSTNSMLVYRAVWEFHKMLPWLSEQGVYPDSWRSLAYPAPRQRRKQNEPVQLKAVHWRRFR